MLIDYALGQSGVILRVKILDSTLATGAGKTGLTFSSGGLRISTIADNEAAATTCTAAGSTIETIATLGTYAAPTALKCRFREVDAANHPGIYEIQIADARYAVAGSKSLLVSITGAAGAADCDVLVPLRAVNPYAGSNFGLSCLPTAAPATDGGLLTRGVGAGQITPSGGNVVVAGYASGQDPAAYVLLTPANKVAVDSFGRVNLQPSQTGVTIGTVTTVSTANLNLGQAIPTSNTAQTVGDALNAARAQGFGRWVLAGTSLTLYAGDGSTVVRTFTLDSASSPTQRT